MAVRVTQLVLALVLVAAAVTAEARLAVRMVQLAHRHGARGPLATDNITQICGTEYPCGELTGVGIEMLNSIGRYVRERYNNLTYVEEAFFPSTRYNSSVVYTRSTGVQRTIQSATAFLRGMFPEDYFYPVIYSYNSTTETEINTDALPTAMGKRQLDGDALAEVINPVLDAHVTWAQLQAAAAAAYSDGACQELARRWWCALTLYDVATAFEAAGRMTEAADLDAVFPALREASAAFYRYTYGYNKSVEMEAYQGSIGQNLAQLMMSNIDKHRVSPSFKLYEFSTHDTMVAPLAVTFGDQTETTMRPHYGVTIIVELLQETEAADEWYVRVLRGTPALLENGSYEFQLDSMQVTCMNATGEQYVSSTGECPLESFRRMIDYSRPTVLEGYCRINQTMYDNLNCPRTIEDNRTVPARCYVYRHSCRQTACPTGYFLSAADFQCYPLRVRGDGCALSVRTAVAGFVLLLVLFLF